jgi:predicted RNase H-like HicB family nuclease
MQSKYRYEVIIYWSEEDQAYIAEVPELPGCAADGRTYQEALLQAETIVAEWIDTATELGR